MNWTTIYILVGLVLCGLNLKAQNKLLFPKKKDTITLLNTVKINGARLTKEQEIKGQKMVQLPEYATIRNSTNPTETMRFNSPIALRDYGNGGVSTARFRGTSPTNTSVLWNGIPINNSGNGLTDFNAIPMNTLDEITVVSGGASTLYGTGAIGGVVLLKDEIHFTKHNDYQLFSSYGDFNTLSNFVKVNLGNKRWGLKIGGSYNSSDNDYEYIDDRFKDENGNTLINENGDYRNYNFDISLGYKISNTHKLYFYSSLYEGDRLFSAGIPNPASGRERNQDFSQRSLLKWDANWGRFNHSLKLAYLTQDYNYFNNRFVSQFSFSETANRFIDYHLKHYFSDKLQLSYLCNFNFSTIETNQITTKHRRSIGMVGLLNYQPFQKTAFLFSIRNEENTAFEIPLSYNVGVDQEVLSNLTIKGNFSKNFRTPTFNEQFWPIVGNPELLPEVSYQLEFGAQLKVKNLDFQASIFNIQIQDKILWLPSAGSNLWSPENIKNTSNKGVEITASFQRFLFKRHLLQLNTNYTYTVATNLVNGNPLPYAPLQFFNFNVDYTYKTVTFFIQGLQQSRSFTTEDSNDFFSIDPVKVYNTGINLKFLKAHKRVMELGFKINNVTNSLYYFTNLRPNPGRNCQIHINYKF